MSNFKIKILFLLLASLFWSNFSFAQAEPLGTCTIHFAFKANEVYPNITKQRCGASGGSWVPNSSAAATSSTITTTPAASNKYSTNTYTLLAPFPGEIDKDFNAAGTNAIGNYLNIMIKIFIGLAGVFAVVAMVMGGIEYMTSELLHTKEHGKSMMTNAILGLLIALGAYTLLNTINPTLLQVDSLDKLPTTQIAYQDYENFKLTEQPITSSRRGFTLRGSTSSGVDAFIANHLSKGEAIREIVVDASGSNKVACFHIGPANDWSQYACVPIAIGTKGFAPAGTGVSGDLKTPLGVSYIGSRRLIAPNSTTAITVQEGQYNVGAAFIDTGIAGRGIGFHGSADNALRPTQGCIRMYNDDLLALAPYMKAGLKVTIK